MEYYLSKERFVGINLDFIFVVCFIIYFSVNLLIKFEFYFLRDRGYL